MPRQRLSIFLSSLYDMVSNEHDNNITWTDNGQSFQILNMSIFCNQTLPQYFQHGKFPNFQRQLNYFGFKRLSKRLATIVKYAHPHFQKHQLHQLYHIHRQTKPTRPGIRTIKAPLSLPSIFENTQKLKQYITPLRATFTITRIPGAHIA